MQKEYLQTKHQTQLDYAKSTTEVAKLTSCQPTPSTGAHSLQSYIRPIES